MRNTAEYREVTVQLEKPVNIMEFNYFYLFTYIELFYFKIFKKWIPTFVIYKV